MTMLSPNVIKCACQGLGLSVRMLIKHTACRHFQEGPDKSLTTPTSWQKSSVRINFNKDLYGNKPYIYLLPLWGQWLDLQLCFHIIVGKFSPHTNGTDFSVTHARTMNALVELCCTLLTTALASLTKRSTQNGLEISNCWDGGREDLPSLSLPPLSFPPLAALEVLVSFAAFSRGGEGALSLKATEIKN